MMKNVGTSERIARTLLALGLGAGSFFLSSSLPGWAVVVVVGAAVGLLFTALTGSCLMNRMLGRNTCSVAR